MVRHLIVSPEVLKLLPLYIDFEDMNQKVGPVRLKVVVLSYWQDGFYKSENVRWNNNLQHEQVSYQLENSNSSNEFTQNT